MFPPLLHPAPHPLRNLRETVRLIRASAPADPPAFERNAPVPGADHKVPDIPKADGSPQDVAQLGVGVAVGGGQRRHVDGVPDGLVARRVNHVPQGLFGVLDAAPLRVPVSEEDQLLLLPRPKAPDAFFVDLQRERPTPSAPSVGRHQSGEPPRPPSP